MESVYTYLRVSTLMQTEGYSIEAQRNRLQDYAAFKGFSIAREYLDAGISGKSTTGRPMFLQMMEDVKQKKDNVRFVLVFKLSRFGRNAADTLVSLQDLQDNGVDLICVEDGIDTSSSAGKLMVSVLSAVAEIERENIAVQTMAGRREKASQGGWNGGTVPYGYKLSNGEFTVVEDEAAAVREIFRLYTHTDLSVVEITKQINTLFNKRTHRSTETKEFSNEFVRNIIRNSFYKGEITYGKSETKKIQGTRSSHRVKASKENVSTSKGNYPLIIDPDEWEAANAKYAGTYRPRTKQNNIYLFSNIICPTCGRKLYGGVDSYHKKNGAKDQYVSYRCVAAKKGTNHHLYREQLIDNDILEALQQVLTEENFACFANRDSMSSESKRKPLADALNTRQNEKTRLQKLQASLNAKLLALNPEDADFSDQESVFGNLLVTATKEINRIDESIKEIETQIEALDQIDKDWEDIKQTLSFFYKALKELKDPEPKRKFYNVLIESIELWPKGEAHEHTVKSVRLRVPLLKDGVPTNILQFGNTVSTVTPNCRNFKWTVFFN